MEREVLRLEGLSNWALDCFGFDQRDLNFGRVTAVHTPARQPFGIARDKKGPMFRSVGKGKRLGDKALSRFDVFHIIKRRG